MKRETSWGKKLNGDISGVSFSMLLLVLPILKTAIALLLKRLSQFMIYLKTLHVGFYWDFQLFFV